PSLLSVLDAMRRRREYRVLTVGTSGAKTPRAAGAPMIQRGLVELPLFGGALQRGRRGVGVDGCGDGVEVAGTDLALVLDGGEATLGGGGELAFLQVDEGGHT